ncbi:MAG: hypothetical protein AB7I33_10395 [Gemmatimonadales bacterium]
MATVACQGQARAVVEALCRNGRHHRTASQVALSLQLPSRFYLHRLLHDARLPSFKILSQWIRLLAVVVVCERDRLAPSALALRDGKNPDAYTRLARRVTGVPWADVRRNGSAWVMIQLSQVCSRAQSRIAAAAQWAAGDGFRREA